MSFNLPKVMLPSRRHLHRALKLLYPIECPDNEDKDNGDSKENDDDTDSELDESHVSHTTSIRPSREVAIKAREKLSAYMDGGNEEKDFGPGSVAEMAK